MGRRTYRMGRRGELADETRRRIVEAASQLHSEQGIAETSMKQIAARAGVSVGAVYHHFPTYDDAIGACARYTTDHAPLPGLEIFDGLTSTADRIERLVKELFGYFEQLPILERVRCDANKFPPLRLFLDEQDRRIGALVSAALGIKQARSGTVDTVAAVLDFAVYQALQRTGFSTKQAASRITDVIFAWLTGTPNKAGQRPKRQKGS